MNHRMVRLMVCAGIVSVSLCPFVKANRAATLRGALGGVGHNSRALRQKVNLGPTAKVKLDKTKLVGFGAMEVSDIREP